MDKNDEKNSPEYLAQLLKDKKQIQAFPNVFVHLERLLDEGEQLYSFETPTFVVFGGIFFTDGKSRENANVFLCVNRVVTCPEGLVQLSKVLLPNFQEVDSRKLGQVRGLQF